MMISPDTILALDSACSAAPAAILVENSVSCLKTCATPGEQARQLAVLVEEIMREAELAFERLSYVAVNVGPGSFTGVRIGLALACGIGFAAKKPVVGISSLSAMAYALREKADGRPVCVFVNAGKGEVYAQRFSTSPFAALDEARVVAPEMIVVYAESGDICAGNVDIAGRNLHLAPDAALIGLLAASGETAFHLPPTPFYIRPPDAKLPQA